MRTPTFAILPRMAVEVLRRAFGASLVLADCLTQLRPRAHAYLFVHGRVILESRRERRLPYSLVTSNKTADPHTI